MDTVEWAMPGLMEALTGDDIVAFEPDSESDEQGAEDGIGVEIGHGGGHGEEGAQDSELGRRGEGAKRIARRPDLVHAHGRRAVDRNARTGGGGSD